MLLNGVVFGSAKNGAATEHRGE